MLSHTCSVYIYMIINAIYVYVIRQFSIILNSQWDSCTGKLHLHNESGPIVCVPRWCFNPLLWYNEGYKRQHNSLGITWTVRHSCPYIALYSHYIGCLQIYFLQGPTYASLMVIWSRWAPKYERTWLVGTSFIGECNTMDSISHRKCMMFSCALQVVTLLQGLEEYDITQNMFPFDGVIMHHAIAP